MIRGLVCALAIVAGCVRAVDLSPGRDAQPLPDGDGSGTGSGLPDAFIDPDGSGFTPDAALAPPVDAVIDATVTHD